MSLVSSGAATRTSLKHSNELTGTGVANIIDDKLIVKPKIRSYDYLSSTEYLVVNTLPCLAIGSTCNSDVLLPEF